ncbi:hypothetical protein PCASD_19747 [Puccinia coronata f. sp. avenae]|uniref:Uncharacterized protein n=1 Tax=Puccinia coronata f. sp. avenae TaxID=200324 RepID=A0A2N5TUF7_9BASI|nr:hypothetical protein PCASD_19747 [Puccinia coronata f. sp. avenae]
MEPAYQPNQGIAPSEVFSRAPSTALVSARLTPVPRPVERLQFCRLAQGSPAPLDGRVYDADRDSPLSPYERSAQGQRNVYRPLAPQPGCSQRARDVHRHRDTSPGQAHDNLQHIPGPMAPLCQRKGKRQLPPHEDRAEPGHINPGYVDKPFRHSTHAGSLGQMVSPGQASQDGTYVPNTSTALTSASRGAARGTNPLASGQHGYNATSPYPTAPPVPSSASCASEISAATGTPASAAAADLRGPRATLSLSGHCAAAGPRADDTWYGTPAGYLSAGSAASVPPSPVTGAGSLLWPGRLLLPVAASSPCALPLRAAIPTRQPVPPPIPEDRHRADPMTRMLQVGSFFMRAERMINRSQRPRGRGGMAPPAYLPPNKNQ